MRRICTFYALSDVKRACADLLKQVPKANRDGFFRADGEQWGMKAALASRLKISESATASRLRSYKSRKGKDARGILRDFYKFSDAKKACANLRKQVPKANRDGFFRADGELWGTSPAIATKLGVSRSPIYMRLDSCRKRDGKDAYGQPHYYYCLSDMRRACADLLAKKKRAA